MIGWFNLYRGDLIRQGWPSWCAEIEALDVLEWSRAV